MSHDDAAPGEHLSSHRASRKISRKTSHVDTFVIDGLPPPHLLPEFVNLDRLNYPERLNAADEFVDRHVREGRGGRLAVRAPGVHWTYDDLARIVNRLANLLVDGLGLVPGNRVLLRSANTPTMVALYLAVIKAGGIVVATMPLLRAKELVQIIDKAEITLAFTDETLLGELAAAAEGNAFLKRVVAWSGDLGGELGQLAEGAPDVFEAVDTLSNDPCLLGFTSGTTGLPKATIHYHRDLLIICDCYAKEILRAEPDDSFIGSPPLAFTFGLGGLVLFPFRVGASTVLPAKTAPDDLARAIGEYRPTICFTAPTAYRAILSRIGEYDLSSLRKCVSAGEALPLPTFNAWKEATGLTLLDGIGATELLHIFIAAPEEAIRPGATGKPVPNYEAQVIDDTGSPVPDGTPGHLAVRGPIGCRYLDDPRQTVYVRHGWNITGDTYIRDADGYFWYQARSDDMIVSAGYNIGGPEVEASLLAHEAVLECGVVAAPDSERGNVVKAYVVLREGVVGDEVLRKALQDHVKRDLAPYKYPRAVEFVAELPKTQSGKLQRAVLRKLAREDAPNAGAGRS
ncbi:MAG: AMP-binding protein [Pseudochelatococcus sp.]|jgi:2-aminobenzoate-CoA ligase|uniref:AMP-binding protein n=1 Tax=Pseudochelatococcus sp. TaxID=2020869 RepID=UPI003D8EE030